MGSYMNPLVGSGWNQPQANQNVLGTLNLNPTVAQGEHGSFGTGPMGNPGNLGDFGSTGSLNKNVMLNNVIAGQFKNMLAPQFAQLMGQYGANAGKDIGAATNFFSQLMNLGSPFYRQHQQEAFTQGVQQNQNAAAQARQQLSSQGYGATPSGANAAMIGGMAQQGSQNLAEQYLQNLFANEQLQTQGAQGMGTMAGLQSQLAGLFNPTQLLGGTSAGTTPQTPNWSNAFSNVAGTLLGGLSGKAGPVTIGGNNG